MKIGLGIITWKRPEYLRQALASVIDAPVHEIFVCIDGGQSQEEAVETMAVCEEFEVPYKLLSSNRGVAVVKNECIKRLMENECKHIFLMEDDNIVLDRRVFHGYIHEAFRTGALHMNFGLHGHLNTGKGRYVIWNGKKVWVYPHIVGAFSYYHRKVFDTIGLLDEHFFNATEHVEHTYVAGKANLTTPFWYFIDHPASAQMLQEIPGSIENSTIRNLPDWQENIAKAKEHWMNKHGTWLPPTPEGWNGR
jgi:glycosyltransferase involved in cell wall biosynthesis